MADRYDIRVSDPDIELMHIHWYAPAPDDSAWIIQKEIGSEKASTIMVNRSEAAQLRDALNIYLANLEPEAQ